MIDLCEWEPMSCFEDLATVNVKKNGTGSGTVTSSPAGINCGVFCSRKFPVGSVVTLTAKAGEGSKFTGWSGGYTPMPGDDCSGTGTCKMTLVFIRIAVFPPPPPPPVGVTATFERESKPNLKDLTVSKAGTGSGTVKSSPAGIDCGSICATGLEEGKEVTLIASPNAGSAFSSWKGCDAANGRECKVTVDAAEAVSAKFTEVKTLSVQKEGVGLGSVKASPGGISCQAACVSAEAEFSAGPPAKEVTLMAAPYKGSAFVEWGGDCSGSSPTCKVTLSAAKSVTAEFAPISKVILTLDKPPGTGTVKSAPASINCAVACSSQTSGFYLGSEVGLTETPYKSAFSQWMGSCSGNLSTCKLTMTEAKTVGAEFVGAPMAGVSLTLTKAEGGTGTGKVTSYPGGINCDASCSSSTAAFKSGAKVVLKQTPAKDSTFAGWGGACSGSSTCEVTLAIAEEVTAEFEAIPLHILTVDKAGGGTGTVKGTPAGVNCGLTCPQAAAAYPQTASVTLTATPGKGSAPVQWTGCDEVVGSLCIAAMSSAKEVTARFE